MIVKTVPVLRAWLVARRARSKVQTELPPSRGMRVTHAACAALLLAAPGLSVAQEARPAAGGTAQVAVVSGVAPGDLLNVRVAASPTGKVVGRLDNGSMLRTDGCELVNGYRWCRVEAVGRGDVKGWAPARYLLAASTDQASGSAGQDGDPEVVKAAAPASGDAPMPEVEPALAALAPASANPAEPAVADAVGKAAAPETAAPAQPPVETAGDKQARGPAPAPPPDISARLGEPAEGVVALDPQRDLIAMLEQDAAQAALSLAFTADENPMTGEIFSPMLEGDDKEPRRAASSPAALPSQPAPARLEPRPVAQLQAAPTPPASDAVGEIPCARYIGQPMSRCEASVVRVGADAAEVTVTLPDGGTRVIRFSGGRPEGSNSRGEFRFTREGDLNMIRVGISERFEITDALAFGD